jgi:hypothetical protein
LPEFSKLPFLLPLSKGQRFNTLKLKVMPIQLQDLLQGQIPEDLLTQLSEQLGGADRDQTSSAVSGIAGLLTGALAKNASSEQGAQALAGALDRDHDGSILDDIVGMLGGQAQGTDSKALNGAGILEHILGNRKGGAAEMISKMSGLDAEKAGSLMQTLAPLVMGVLGKTKREQGLDAGGLMEMLGQAANSKQAQQNPAVGFITKMLDKDGDGSAMDDIARMGMHMLGSLFKKK